jgi:predicted enzyme related to lactoylglutathione lyase
MIASLGRFIWYELITTDMKAAAAFYSSVVGWETRDASMPGMPYTLFTMTGTSVSGVIKLPEQAALMGAKPCWIGYVSVDDPAATAGRAVALGGVVHVPPQVIPDISSFAVVADPQGVTFGLFKWLMRGRDHPRDAATLGEVGWHELMAADAEKAFAFYSALFGWQTAATESGPTGTYQLFSVAGHTSGGMINKPATAPIPLWLHYFNVGDIDGAMKRVAAGGGQMLYGPVAVPGDKWVVQGMDPQGAMFAMMGTRKPDALGYFKRTEAGETSSLRFGGRP